MPLPLRDARATSHVKVENPMALTSDQCAHKKGGRATRAPAASDQSSIILVSDLPLPTVQKLQQPPPLPPPLIPVVIAVPVRPAIRPTRRRRVIIMNSFAEVVPRRIDAH